MITRLKHVRNNKYSTAHSCFEYVQIWSLFVLFFFFFCCGVKLTITTHLRHLRGDQYSLVRDFSAFLNFPFGGIIIPLDSIASPNKVTEILPRTVVTYLVETSIHNFTNRCGEEAGF